MSVPKLQMDIRRSSLFGPIQVLLNTLSYVLLYPIIIRVSGLDVLGLWSLLVSISLYISLTDVGFSITITRKLSAVVDEGGLNEVVDDYRVARIFYYLLVGGLAVIWVTIQYWVVDSSLQVYSAEALRLSILLLIIGTGIQLVAQLDMATLVGFHQTYYAKKIETVVPAVRLVVGIYAAMIGRPLEGLAIALIVANFVKIPLFRMRRLSECPTWGTDNTDLSFAMVYRRLIKMISDGRHIYVISLGSLLREPIFRVVVTLTLGLSAAGVYDVAKRIPDLLRNLLVGGAQSFLPAYGHLLKNGMKSEVEQITKIIVRYLTLSGAILLGAYFLLAEAIISFWLPGVNDQMVYGSRIMCVWASITLVNVPYWYLLQAAHMEKNVAWSMWAHTASILLLVPICLNFEMMLSEMLIFWCVTSVLAQGVLYYHVQREFGFWYRTVSPAVISYSVAVILVTAFAI